MADIHTHLYIYIQYILYCSLFSLLSLALFFLILFFPLPHHTQIADTTHVHYNVYSVYDIRIHTIHCHTVSEKEKKSFRVLRERERERRERERDEST